MIVTDKFAGKGLDALNVDVFSNALQTQTNWVDPCAWVEDRLGVVLFSNQIEVIEELRDPEGEGFNVLQNRGAGKTQAVAWGLCELACNRPGTQIIIAAPIEKQAGRIIRYMKQAMQAPASKVKHEVDWGSASALRLPFKNGSVVVAVSGQEKANAEGEHGHVLVIDEAHLVPSYSVTNKLVPMVGMLGGYSKIIKIGTAIGRNHFYKSCIAKSARNIICKWDESEIFLMEPKPFFYNGRQYSKKLISRMPVPMKVKYFPDRPDLHDATGYEITELDWLTQYEMEWIDDINNFLSEKDQAKLASGTFVPTTLGLAGEVYFAGLDTAYSGNDAADRTVLSIWRLLRSGTCEKVASYMWHGDPLGQEQEIWGILNPKKGLFKCEAIFADYSNIGITMIERFRQAGLPIVGVTFGSSASKVGSPKNWKNTLYDHFLIRLQSGELAMPNVEEMRVLGVDASPEMKVQIDNMLEGFWQWCVLQRIRGKGINDKIEAPTDQVEDGSDGTAKVAHDDACSADILAVWAARHRDDMRKEMMRGGLGLMTYEIPMPVMGGTMGAPTSPAGGGGGFSENPYDSRNAAAGQQSSAVSVMGSIPMAPGQVNIQGLIGVNRKKI